MIRITEDEAFDMYLKSDLEDLIPFNSNLCPSFINYLYENGYEIIFDKEEKEYEKE